MLALARTSEPSIETCRPDTRPASAHWRTTRSKTSWKRPASAHLSLSLESVEWSGTASCICRRQNQRIPACMAISAQSSRSERSYRRPSSSMRRNSSGSMLGRPRSL